MARPCGCGSGGIIVHCGTGLSCFGAGTSGDPLVVSWEIPLQSVACEAVMDCVGDHIGGGLEYFPVAHQVAAKISSDAGNLIGFGSDGGLLSTGSPDPALGGVTIAGLPASDLIAGSYGAGFQMWPDGYRKSYEAAMADDNITLIHVPVRRSQDSMLYAVHDRNIGWYTNDTGTSSPIPTWNADTVDVPMAHQLMVRPSGKPELTFDNVGYNTRQNGYFGYAVPEQQGVLLLQDVFRITSRRKCMFLECKDLGGSAGTVLPYNTLKKTVDLVVRWGLQKSVIIACELGTGDQDNVGIKAGLQYANAQGIQTAVMIATLAEATANTPQSLITLGCTWVGISFTLAAGTITPYIAAGLQTLMFTGDRQWHWSSTQVLGARGLLSSDPVYVAGHKTGFPYRPVNPPSTAPHVFTSQAPEYGRVGYSSAIASAHAKNRGYVDRPGTSTANTITAGPEMTPPSNSGFHMPMGVFCPIYDPALSVPPPQGVYGAPTNYDIEVSVAVAGTAWQGSGQQGMGLFFCVPVDVRLFDLTAANSQTIGYSLVLNSSGQFTFRRYDGVNGTWQFSNAWASGWGTLAITTQYKIMVQVRPGSIRCGPSTANGGITGANSRLFTATNPTDAQGDLYRGPYFYLSYWEAAGYTGFRRFADLKVVNY
jgi:hypothetical protein